MLKLGQKYSSSCEDQISSCFSRNGRLKCFVKMASRNDFQVIQILSTRNIACIEEDERTILLRQNNASPQS